MKESFIHTVFSAIQYCRPVKRIRIWESNYSSVRKKNTAQVVRSFILYIHFLNKHLRKVSGYCSLVAETCYVAVCGLWKVLNDCLSCLDSCKLRSLDINTEIKADIPTGPSQNKSRHCPSTYRLQSSEPWRQGCVTAPSAFTHHTKSSDNWKGGGK